LVAAAAVASAMSAESKASGLADAAAVLAVYVAALLVHEGAHAWVARNAGLHVDGIIISAFGGVTRYSGADPGARALRRIALAGPKASFAAMLASLLVAAGASAAGWHNGPGALAAWSVEVNLFVGAVNLLPFGTLDGAAARRASRSVSTAPQTQEDDPLP